MDFAELLKGCNDCGPLEIPSISTTIVQTCEFLVKGHAGVREMYNVLAQRAQSEDDRRLFHMEAAKHDRIIREISNLVIPEEGDLHGSREADVRPGEGAKPGG